MLTATASPQAFSTLHRVCALFGLHLIGFRLYDHPMHAKAYQLDLVFHNDQEFDDTFVAGEFSFSLQALHVDPVVSPLATTPHPIPLLLPDTAINHILAPRIQMLDHWLQLLQILRTEYTGVTPHIPPHDTAYNFLRYSLTSPTSELDRRGICVAFPQNPEQFLHLGNPRINAQRWTPENRVATIPFAMSQFRNPVHLRFLNQLRIPLTPAPLYQLPTSFQKTLQEHNVDSLLFQLTC